MQWLYTAPVYPDGLQWSEDGRVAVSVGTVAATMDPYGLEERCAFTELRGFEGDSVAQTGGTPRHVSESLRFAFETLKEFAMRDATWKATVRSVAWSPKQVQPQGRGCLLAVVYSEGKVRVYASPRNKARDQMECLGDLTESLMLHFRNGDAWELKEEEELEGGRRRLRLRGGGKGRSRIRGRGKGRKRRVAARDGADQVSSESEVIIQNFQFSKEMDPVLSASLEAENGRQFRLDLAKVILALWLEVRSKIPENELPTYKKGEFLFGVDYRIFVKVMEHIMEMYGEYMKTFAISQKTIEVHSRSLIRKKAIVSYDPVWKGRKFHQPESVLSLIGQEVKEEEQETKGGGVPSLFQSTKIVTDKQSALCVAATNQTVRQVKPQSGRKRKSMGPGKPQLSCHFPKKIPNETYDRRLSMLSATCVAWVPRICRQGELLAVGTQSGHVVLWSDESQHHEDAETTDRPEFRVLGSCCLSSSQISMMKSKAVQTSADDGSSRLRQLLVVGDTAGCVKLWELDEQALDASQDSQENAEWLLGGVTVCPPDQRPISALYVDCTALEGQLELEICAGKYGGTVSVWRSRRLAHLCETGAPLWQMEGRLLQKEDCHSNKAITGIVCIPFMNLVATVGLDSQLCLWRVENERLVSLDLGIGHSECHFSEFQPLYGIAASPSGLMLALLKDSGEKYQDAQLQRMVWKRVAHGFIEFKSLVRFENSNSWREALEYICTRMDEHPSSAFLADVGQMVKMMLTEEDRNALQARFHEQELLGEDIEAEAKEDMDHSQESTAWTDKQSGAMAFIQAILDTMKQYNIVWNPEISDKEIQRLRAFVSFYHTVKDISAVQTDQAAMLTAETSLLVHHVMRVFSLEDQNLSDRCRGRLSSLLSCAQEDVLFTMQELMAKWVLRLEQQLPTSIMHEARKWTRRLQGQQWPDLSLFNSDQPDPVTEATQCSIVIDDSVVKFNRCPASFVCMQELTEMSWTCKTCQRRYLVPPQEFWAVEVAPLPVCLFCGMFLER